MDGAAAALLLETGFSHCRVVAVEHGGLLSALFLTGLIGSFSHCVGMCGPFVLSQAVARLEAVTAARLSERTRLTAALLLPYHLGRASSYALLGALAAWFAGRFGALTGVRWLSAALLVLAALGFLVTALARLGARLPVSPGLPGATGWAMALADAVRPLFATPVGLRGYALGLSLGFLPCGLVYGALAVAAATGDALAGTFGMLAFAAGTVPALLAVGLAGYAADHAWRRRVAQVLPAMMIANAGFLAWLAGRMVAG